MSLEPEAAHQVVHPVEAAQRGALAASGRADESGDGPLHCFQRHLADGYELAIVSGQIWQSIRDRLPRRFSAVECSIVRSLDMMYGASTALHVG